TRSAVSKSSAAVDTLYGEEADAKAKAKASRRSPTRAVTPGVEHVLSLSNNKKDEVVSALYGSDSDSKAKSKTSGRSYAPAVVPGVEYSHSPATSMSSISPKSTRTISTLYGNDADIKSKSKSIRGSRYPGMEQYHTAANRSTASTMSNTTMSTLYGNDAESKAKAKGSRNVETASFPGVEYLNSTRSTRSNVTISTLYGDDSDAKAKLKRSRGTRELALNPGVESVHHVSTTASLSDDGTFSMSSTDFPCDGDGTAAPTAKRVSIGSIDPKNYSDPRKANASPTAGDSLSFSFRMPSDPETAPDSDEDNRTVEEKPRKSRKKRMLCCFFLLVSLIVGGAAVWYFIFRGDTQITFLGIQDPTSAPITSDATTTTTLAPSALLIAPSQYPSALPTSLPPTVTQLYERPSETTCELIARNETVAGRDLMETANFGLDMEVVLSDGSNITEPLLQELLDSIQEKILPSLAGCSVIVDTFVEAWRFVIFDAFVKGNVQGEEVCEDKDLITQNCHRVFVELALFLKGEVRFLDIIGLISDETLNMSKHLGLSDPFLVVKMIGAKGLEPTASPTIMPSDTPSLSPTHLPSVQPSASPTSVPTGEPSAFPTHIPSLEPSIGLTGEPTVAPTESPSMSPSAPESIDSSNDTSHLNPDAEPDPTTNKESYTTAYTESNPYSYTASDSSPYTSTHARPNDWWQVDLATGAGNPVVVDYITVWNREENAYGLRLVGAIVQLLDASGNDLTPPAVDNVLTADRERTINFGMIPNVSFVKITQNGILALSEVEVYGYVP
ncbi:MAG: hypothetical protein SGBAC_009179, partial [Bacillariaceae sp.]